MSVMSISTTAWRSLSIVTLASASRRKLPRIAAATPMPTSQLPSRTWPGRALRLSQPKRCAPSLRQGTRARVENGTFFSGSSLGSFFSLSSMGSMSRRTASSSIACSTARSPIASPGARIESATGRSSAAMRWLVMRLGAA